LSLPSDQNTVGEMVNLNERYQKSLFRVTLALLLKQPIKKCPE
jgi:hypothetical protein